MQKTTCSPTSVPLNINQSTGIEDAPNNTRHHAPENDATGDMGFNFIEFNGFLRNFVCPKLPKDRSLQSAKLQWIKDGFPFKG